MAMMNQLIADGYAGDKLAQQEIFKEYARQAIRNVWAPLYASELEKIKSTFKSEVKESASTAKNGLRDLSGKLDSEMKGAFSQKVQTTLSEKNQLWDDLSK